MPDDNRRSPRPGDGLHGGGRYTFQNTGFGWWRDGEIAETLRTPVGGDAMKANLVVEVLPFDTTQITSDKNWSHPKYGDSCHPLAAGQHPPMS